jgi:plastocyanin
MIRLRLSLLAGAAVATALLASTAFAKDSGGLKGEVYPNFKIEFKNNGRDVKTLRAGTYTIKVEDKTSIHNFHLVGPGVNRSTGIAFTGERTWRLALKPGKYTFMCDAHATTMRGSFRVTR